MVSQVANADLTGPLRGKRVTLWRSERCPQFPPAPGVLGAGTRGRAVASGARGAKSQPRRGRAEGVAASNGLSVSPPLPSRGPAEGRRVPGAAPALRPGESGSALLRPAACHLPAPLLGSDPKGQQRPQQPRLPPAGAAPCADPPQQPAAGEATGPERLGPAKPPAVLPPRHPRFRRLWPPH